jgi:hypothetical protein
MKMKTGGKIIVSVLSVLAVGTLALGAVYALNPNFKKTADDWITSVIVHDSTSVSNSVSESGSESVQPELAVRQLASGTDEQGHAYITFSYTLTPSNTTWTNIVASLAWKEIGVTDVIANFLSSSVDLEAKTITVTCLAPFSNVAELTIKCETHPSIKTKVEIHCGQKFLGFNELSQGSFYYDMAIYDDEGTQGCSSFNNAEWNTDLNRLLSKGFSTTFTDAIDTTPTIGWSSKATLESKYSEIKMIGAYGDDPGNPVNPTILSGDYKFYQEYIQTPAATRVLTKTLFQEDSFNGSGSVAHPYVDLIASLQADINAWTPEALDQWDYSMIGISYPVTYSLTIAGQTEIVDIDIVLMFGDSLTYSVPLSRITPEIPSITF